MKVVVYPHRMAVGGSQLNAIELGAAVAELGHGVIVPGQPGGLVERVSDLGLELIPAPQPRGRPAPKVMRALPALVRERGVDVAYGYECLAAFRLQSRIDQVRGRFSADDFNAKAVAGQRAA